MPIYKLDRNNQQEAHYQVARAIRQGRLEHQSKFPCADCGAPSVHYDHRDYLKPLAVEPVCRSCNYKRGTALNKSE